MASKSKALRCGVYTRKSSEEGLDQAFNSLDAQREACEAYIKSQTHEGWRLVKADYDDGGLSGGTLERPALQRLLSDIEARHIDIVVVYKVDRLTRSLADFAKIVEVFDTYGVSFVSVTQAFNTTSSMGRLTLNMLLSFAQFEREVTGERIRDKIAASKRMGMWMGGFVPLGYDAKDRTLVINVAEAETVRKIFDLYLELGTVRRVKAQVDRLGLTTKRRTTQQGRMRGGRPLSRGYIYKLLGNPIYAGRIAHKGEIYDGQHKAIIDDKTWVAVQAKFASHSHDRQSGTRAAQPSLLAGLIHDDQDSRMAPTHAVKRGRRYRYYISQHLTQGADGADQPGIRIPAHEVEALVLKTMRRALTNKAELFDRLNLDRHAPNQARDVLTRAHKLAGELQTGNAGQKSSMIRDLLERVIIGDQEVRVTVSVTALKQKLGLNAIEPNLKPTEVDHLTITVPITLKRCNGASKLILYEGEAIDRERRPDPAVVRAIVRANDWFDRLATGQVSDLATIARKEGLTRSYVCRVLRLAFLAPDITEAILDGRQPAKLTAERLVRYSDLPLCWQEQRRVLGVRSELT